MSYECDGNYRVSSCNIDLFLCQGKWDVPLPKVKAVGEDEVFKVIKTGRSKSKLNC